MELSQRGALLLPVGLILGSTPLEKGHRIEPHLAVEMTVGPHVIRVSRPAELVHELQGMLLHAFRRRWPCGRRPYLKGVARRQVSEGPHSGGRLVGRWDSSGHGLLREYSRELAGARLNSCRCNRGRYQPCVSGGPVVSPTSSCADRRTVRGLSAGSTMRSRSRFAAIVPISRAG